MIPVHPMRLPKILLLSCAALLSCNADVISSNRYSYSLTTFDPSGKLFQVDRAMEAAAQGSPIVALVLEHSLILAAPQNLPSPFVIDEGTPRFTSITPSIVLGYTGLSGDGRVLSMNAHRMALNYRYTFDSNIPLETLLQQLSLQFQEFTMKPGRRPFGCTIIIGYVPHSVGKDEEGERPQIFRVDPSGAITILEEGGTIINWKGDHEDLGQLKKELEKLDGTDHERHVMLSTWLQKQLSTRAQIKGDKITAHQIVVASASSGGSFSRGCYHEDVGADDRQ